MNAFNQLLTRSRSGGGLPPLNTTFAYDDVGNQIRETAGAAITTLAWDRDDRLLSVMPPAPGAPTAYSYDANSLRIERMDAAGTTRYLRDGARVLAELDGANAVTTRYLNNPRRIDEAISFERGGATYWPLTDALGSWYAVTDSTGAVARRYDFDVYGTRADLGGAGPALDVGFTGQRHDANGLMGAIGVRPYMPLTGAWLEPDRAGMIDGPNLYAYVKNAPTMFTDPTGRTLQTYSGPTRQLYLSTGLHYGELHGNSGAQVDDFLDSMRAKHYSFSFFKLFDAVIGFGLLHAATTVQTRGQSHLIVQMPPGKTFPAGGCHADAPTSVVDVGNVLIEALDYANRGHTTSVEETIAHELGHAKGLSIFSLSRHADEIDPGLSSVFACDEEKQMHRLMYNGDPVAAEATWDGCSGY